MTADERLTTSFPLAAYAFESSPLGAARIDEFRDYLPYQEGNRTLITEEGGATLAAASAIPMRQNLRGWCCRWPASPGGDPPAGPPAGHVRTLLHQLLDEMRDEGMCSARSIRSGPASTPGSATSGCPSHVGSPSPRPTWGRCSGGPARRGGLGTHRRRLSGVALVHRAQPPATARLLDLPGLPGERDA
ncbi:hypothetical protein NKG94_33910 [Micromonospora sp. M12]